MGKWRWQRTAMIGAVAGALVGVWNALPILSAGMIGSGIGSIIGGVFGGAVVGAIVGLIASRMSR